jgi:MFS family permease
MVSVPLGSLLTDRLGRPNLPIVAGSLVAALVTMLLPSIEYSLLAFCLVGLAIGAPPGALMALLPKAVASQRLATALGVYYTMYYIVMAVVQLAAGGVRDLFDTATAPIVLAAVVMAATIVGFATFRLVERTAPRAG